MPRCIERIVNKILWYSISCLRLLWENRQSHARAHRPRPRPPTPRAPDRPRDPGSDGDAMTARIHAMIRRDRGSRGDPLPDTSERETDLSLDCPFSPRFHVTGDRAPRQGASPSAHIVKFQNSRAREGYPSLGRVLFTLYSFRLSTLETRCAFVAGRAVKRNVILAPRVRARSLRPLPPRNGRRRWPMR